MALPLTMIPLIEGSAHGTTLRWALALVLWAVWASGFLACLVPSTVSLTVGRLLAPLPLLCCLLAAIAGVDGLRLGLAVALSGAVAVIWYSAEVGIHCAQGSAYGDEHRFPLRPPVPMLVPMALTWALGAACGVGAVLAVGDRRWLIGVLLAGLVVAFAVIIGPRFHQLSRRWLVVVPAGLVVHDALVLADNMLFRSPALRIVHLAPGDSQAADLTGGTTGTQLEIVLAEMDTVTKAATRQQPKGTALHVLSVLVAPSRPGKVLHAAADRQLPVA